MSYRIAGIDVHKKMLAVVVSEVEIEGAYEFERRMFGSSPDQLRSLAAWLLEQEVEEVVMESTAQYWKPVWEALERYWKPLREKREGASRRSGTLHLAQAQSNRGPRGRKKDFRDAERLVKRLILNMALEQLQFLEQQIGQLDQEMASLLHLHQDAVQRLAEVPGLGVDSAQQIIAEVGSTAATFPSAKCLSSWVGACPGDEESAGMNYSHRSPQGNRHMRRLLNQAANAAARTKGSIFEIAYRRSVPRLGHNQAIGAIAHRQCRLIWLILHQGVRYEERGPAVTQQSKQARTARMIRQLQTLGYRIEPPNPQPSQAQAQ